MAVPTGGNKADEGPVYGGNEEQTVIDSKKRVYKCSYEECEKIYTKSSHLKAHLRSHTGRYNRLFVYLFGCLSSVLSVSLLVRLSINLAILCLPYPCLLVGIPDCVCLCDCMHVQSI